MSAIPYDARAITVLQGLQAVRQRPAMYIGSTGTAGLHQLVYELVQNAVDEAMAGHCAHISVRLLTGGALEVEDDGRGIPVDPHPLDGRPAAEVVLTTLHAGGKFNTTGGYGVTGGLHGVGVSCVTALASSLELEIHRDGSAHLAQFSRGDTTLGLHPTGPSPRTGTRIRFVPDPQIFANDVRIDKALLRRRLQEQAFLHPGLTVRLEDLRGASPQSESWHSDEGLPGFVRSLNAERSPLHRDPIHLKGQGPGIVVDLCLQWTTAYAEETLGFVNGIFTSQGGSHIDGLRAALSGSLIDHARTAGLLSRSQDEDDGQAALAGYDLREGLTAVLAIRLEAPEYEGQTKSMLTSLSAAPAVEAIVSERLQAWLQENPAEAAAIIGKALEASRARAAARRASERARYQSFDAVISKEVYQQQFGIRSKNWHQSARWITDGEILGAHADLFTGPEDAKVLDVCCGSGVVGNSFRGKVGSIIGLDLTPEMIRMAKTRLDDVIQGDVYDMPFPDGEFDLVCNREVLHLLPRPEKPVAQIFRVLKPGGQFIVGQLVPYGPEDAPWFFRIVKKKQPLFFNNLMAEDMVRLLENAGFVDIETKEVLAWEDIDTWIDTWETPNLHRHEIRALYDQAPAEVRRVHPFEIRPDGRILDLWRWVVFSARKPL